MSMLDPSNVIQRQQGSMNLTIVRNDGTAIFSKNEEAPDLTFLIEQEFFHQGDEPLENFQLYQGEEGVKITKDDQSVQLSQDQYNWLFRQLTNYRRGLLPGHIRPSTQAV